MTHETRPSRRDFLKRSAALPSAALAMAAFTGSGCTVANRKKDEDSIDGRIQVPRGVRQTDILFDDDNYTAFPHIERLEGDELLIAFRQAPRQPIVRHTHPRSVITVMRSYDLGETWDAENAAQLAAGGGQEFAPIYLGQGLVGGLLAMHEVVPVAEAERSGLPHDHRHEYPFGNVGGLWCWSENYGLTWQLHHTVLFARGMQSCAPPVRLESGTILAPCYGSVVKGTFESAVLHRSDDLGRTWSSRTIMAAGDPKVCRFYEPAVLEVKTNHLLGMLRTGECHDGRGGYFWQNESRDGGTTWSEPVETDIRSGACPRLLKLADGRILLTYGRRFEPYGLYARLSDDGGTTWSDTHWLLRRFPNQDQGYSSSLELEAGRILTTCYAQNNRGVTGITGTFWDLPNA